MSQMKQANRIDWQTILLGTGLLLLIGASYAYFRNKKINQTQLPPASNEILYKEEGVVGSEGDKETKMSEEEKRRIKEQIKSVLESNEAKQTSIYQLTDGVLKGEAKRVFSNGKFYFSAYLNDLSFPQKGYYYEAWLENDIANFFSLGRLEIAETGRGEIYYLVSGDKSSYKTVKITLEPEDGNPNQAAVLFLGKFN